MPDLRRSLIFATLTLLTVGVCASLRVDDEPPREPTLRLVRFELEDPFLMAVSRFSNRTTQPIYFYGHHPEVPMQSLESRGTAGWADCGSRWCGSGATTHELKPGESIELRTPVGMLDLAENDDAPFYRKIDPRRPLRVRTHFGFAGERAISPVWSNEFRHPQHRVASARELAP